MHELFGNLFSFINHIFKKLVLMSSTIETRIIVNTVPHSGTHLVATVLELVGFEQAKRFDWNSLSFKKVGINWRTSLLSENTGINGTDKSIPVSVGSPQLVRAEIIEKILNKIKPSRYVLSHIPHSSLFEKILLDNYWKGITIIRDPRDMCLSMLNHIESRPHHLGYRYLYEELQTRHERIKALVDGFNINNEYGDREFGKVDRMLNTMIPWENVKNFIFLRFEDLVGPKGGGSEHKQLESVKKICSHLEIEINNISRIADNAFGKLGTFRKGQLGRWKSELSHEENELFKVHNELICFLGYEPS